MTNLNFVQQNLKSLFFLILISAIFLSDLCAQSQSNPRNNLYSALPLKGESNKLEDFNRPRLVKNAEAGEEVKKTAAVNSLILTAEVITELERQAFAMLNEKRKENNLPALVWNQELAKIARRHSQDMAKYNFFSHTGRDGSMVNERADATGFSNWRAIGENIAFNQGFNKPVDFAYEQWMLSPKHRQNMLSNRWSETGIGAALTTGGAYYFTQVFAVR